MSQTPVVVMGLPEDGHEAQESKGAALSYMDEAFAEARHDGLDADSIAYAALFAAWSDLVGRHGVESVAKFAETVPDKILQGAYSPVPKH